MQMIALSCERFFRMNVFLNKDIDFLQGKLRSKLWYMFEEINISIDGLSRCKGYDELCTEVSGICEVADWYLYHCKGLAKKLKLRSRKDD